MREREYAVLSGVCVAGERAVRAVSRRRLLGALPAGPPSRGAVGTRLGRGGGSAGVRKGPAERRSSRAEPGGTLPGAPGPAAPSGRPPSDPPRGPALARPQQLLRDPELRVQSDLRVRRNPQVRERRLSGPRGCRTGKSGDRLRGAGGRPGASAKFGRV